MSASVSAPQAMEHPSAGADKVASMMAAMALNQQASNAIYKSMLAFVKEKITT